METRVSPTISRHQQLLTLYMNWIGDRKKLLEDTHAKVDVKFLQSTKIASSIRTIFRYELSIVLGDSKLFKNSGIMLQENVYTCEFHDPSSRTKGPQLMLALMLTLFHHLFKDFVAFRRLFDEVYHALHIYKGNFHLAVRIFLNTVLDNKV